MGNRASGTNRPGEFESLMDDAERDASERLRSPFVALDIEDDRDEKKIIRENYKFGWEQAMPMDIFVHFFAYLSPQNLASVATVNKAWKLTIYDPSLWNTLDLSKIYYRVDDTFLENLLSESRFGTLSVLSLEGCSAITSRSIKTIQKRCKSLRRLLLTDCHLIDPYALLPFVDFIPLDFLELHGVSQEYDVARKLNILRPHMNLGFFWLEYCASVGLKLNGQGNGMCRHEEAINERGCWGPIKGKIIYSNRFYHRSGNYPAEVIYACAAHHNQDFSDRAFQTCEMCNRLFRPSSMWTELICRKCFDQENLQEKKVWVPLTRQGINNFGLSDIVSKTLRIADRKNLPSTLKPYGFVPCRLDYKLPLPPPPAPEPMSGGPLPDDDDDNKALLDNKGLDVKNVNSEQGAENDGPPPINSGSVPMTVFLDANRWRVDDQIAQFREKFKNAVKARNTRALLVFDSKDNIEVLADRRSVLDGRDGEDNLQLTVLAWMQGLGIMYPILAVMVCVLYFTQVFDDEANYRPEQDSNYTVYLYDEPTSAFSPAMLLIMGGVFLLVLIVGIFCLYRYRERCERLFKKFLVLDILLIFCFGGGAVFMMIAQKARIPAEEFTFFVFVWNFGFLGLLSLYYKVIPAIHKFYLIVLNSIMAIMMITTLGKYVIFFLLAIAAAGDVVSEIRPRMRFLSPFILPAHVELVYETPRILYQVGTLRLRAADLMWYGLMMGLVDITSIVSITSTFISVLSALAIVVFVTPFFGKRFRPLPVALLFVAMGMLWNPSLLSPYISSFNFLKTTTLLA